MVLQNFKVSVKFHTSRSLVFLGGYACFAVLSFCRAVSESSLMLFVSCFEMASESKCLGVSMSRSCGHTLKSRSCNLNLTS